MYNFLFRRTDIVGLALFRITFGLLIALESFGAIATGWVHTNLITPDFTFNFIGFEFLQPLPGNGMYLYFTLMGLCGLAVMLGFKYRLAMSSFTLLWAGVYFMQKIAYNNHYYLLILLCLFMTIVPANRLLSWDAKQNPALKRNDMPYWAKFIFILQVGLVFTYAAIAKIYPDWLNTTVIEHFMKPKENYWLIGSFLQLKWVHYGIAYLGIAFDLCIVPLFLWKRTRLFAFIASLGFHLFNSVVFQIGIFPYLSIAFAFFFFSAPTLRKRFKLKKAIRISTKTTIPKHANWAIALFVLYFITQLVLPLRHWTFKDNVLWTEEGHRLSWRMMLRGKHGTITYWVTDKATGKRSRFNHRKLLSKKQAQRFAAHPDMIWQLAQRIKTIEAKQGRDVIINVTSRISVNGRKMMPYIDPNADLGSEKWLPFKHHDWLLESPPQLMPKSP